MSTQETGQDEPDREVSWSARVRREPRREIGLMVETSGTTETTMHMMIICGSRLDVPLDGSRTSTPSAGTYLCTLPPHGDTGHACAVRNGAGQDEVPDVAQGTYRTAVWDGPAGETVPLLGWSRTEPQSSHVQSNLDVRTSRLFTAMRTMLASAAGPDTWEDMERVDMPLPDRLAEVINRFERAVHAERVVAVRDATEMVASLETTPLPDEPLPSRINRLVLGTRRLLEEALIQRDTAQQGQQGRQGQQGQQGQQGRSSGVLPAPEDVEHRAVGAADAVRKLLIHPGDALRYRLDDAEDWSDARFVAISDAGTVVVDEQSQQPHVLGLRLAPPRGSVHRFALTNEARRGETR